MGTTVARGLTCLSSHSLHCCPIRKEWGTFPSGAGTLALSPVGWLRESLLTQNGEASGGLHFPLTSKMVKTGTRLILVDLWGRSLGAINLSVGYDLSVGSDS